ncbi:MAG TPA: acyl-CoA thioesterase [Myxococcales bacterium]|jgi:acyl-CoA hydrolase|nr:acyl-CoA thioesterase [Myxococcales bacterium]
MSLPPKPARDSAVDMAELVLPQDANPRGTAFGGRIVQWIDLCAGMAAARHTRRPVVTASMDDLHFHAPLKIGYQALLGARITGVFHTSMEIYVRVMAENPLTGERTLCTDAYLTFVALDDAGRPCEVPPLQLETPEEHEAFRRAQERREQRLQRSSSKRS